MSSMQVAHISRNPYRVQSFEMRPQYMRAEREYGYGPSRIPSYLSYEPSVSYEYESSIRPSNLRLWDSTANTNSLSQNAAKDRVKPKTSSWLTFGITVATALVTAGATAGIFGTIALTSRQTTNTTYVIDMPTGTILLYSGNMSGLPDRDSRWLLCNGAAVSRVTYLALFNVIGTMYGIGDGMFTFNLPDYQGRFPLGSNPMNDTSMPSGGSATQTLNVSQLPAHTHDQGTLQTVTAGAHVHTLYDPGHNHGGVTNYVAYAAFTGYGVQWTGAAGLGWIAHAHTIAADVTGVTMQSNGDHTHATSGSTASQGSGTPVNIMPPYQTVHYIIRT